MKMAFEINKNWKTSERSL